jgi:hypothetical protein
MQGQWKHQLLKSSSGGRRSCFVRLSAFAIFRLLFPGLSTSVILLLWTQSSRPSEPMSSALSGHPEHFQQSGSRHIARSVRISRATRSCTL